jgi:hypothetical protein
LEYNGRSLFSLIHYAAWNSLLQRSLWSGSGSGITGKSEEWVEIHRASKAKGNMNLVGRLDQMKVQKSGAGWYGGWGV